MLYANNCAILYKGLKHWMALVSAGNPGTNLP
jgi:hypothetical protein